jgi:hypothetical protein
MMKMFPERQLIWGVHEDRWLEDESLAGFELLESLHAEFTLKWKKIVISRLIGARFEEN